jgi:predicted DNA-binding protein
MAGNQVKTTVRIREDLFLKLKLLATIRGEYFNTMVNEAIEVYLREHEKELKKIPEVVR